MRPICVPLLWALLSLARAYMMAPPLEIIMKERKQAFIEAVTGSDLTLVPKYSGDPTEISWKVNGFKLVDMELNRSRRVVFHRLTDRAVIDPTGRLNVSNLSKEDSGLYHAEVMVNHRIQSTAIGILVFDGIIRKVVGSVVTLKLNYSEGTAENTWWSYKYEWSKPLKEFHFPPLLIDRASIDQSTGSLTIRDLTKGDTAVYRADVVLNNITHEKEMRLRVIGRVSKPVIKDQSTTDLIILHCASFTPRVTYQWLDEDRHVVSTKQKYVTFRPREDVTLTCVVNDGVSRGKKSITVLSASDPTDDIIRKAVGDDVTLKLNYSEEASEVTWWLGNNQLVRMKPWKEVQYHRRLIDRARIDNSTGSLTIRDLAEEDTGAYRAEIMLNNTTHEKVINLVVIGRVSKPIIKDQSTTDLIILHCASFTPRVTYQWLDEDTQIISNKQKYVTFRQRGEVILTCVVDDGVSGASESITIPSTSGNAPEVSEIFVQPGSDVLLPMTRRITLNDWNPRSYTELKWMYDGKTGGPPDVIAERRNKSMVTYNASSYTYHTEEDGNLVIYNVSREHEGLYTAEMVHKYVMYAMRSEPPIPNCVHINRLRCEYIERTYDTLHYRLHVQDSVSHLVLNMLCLPDGSADISCMVEAGTDPSIYLSVNGGAMGSYSSVWKRIIVTTPSPGPWDVTCYVQNGVSRMEINQTQVTCPEMLPEEGSVWVHFMFRGPILVMYSALFICMVTDLRNMREEEKRSRNERRMTIYQGEMQMEPIYCNCD